MRLWIVISMGTACLAPYQVQLTISLLSHGAPPRHPPATAEAEPGIGDHPPPQCGQLRSVRDSVLPCGVRTILSHFSQAIVMLHKPFIKPSIMPPAWGRGLSGKGTGASPG